MFKIKKNLILLILSKYYYQIINYLQDFVLECLALSDCRVWLVKSNFGLINLEVDKLLVLS